MSSVMEKLIVVVLMLMCGRAVYCEAAIEEQCSLSKPTDAKLSLKVHKNITGHWVTQVTFNHGPTANQADNEQFDLWEVDVKQTTVPCERGDGVVIEATLSSPSRRAGPGYELFPGVGYFKLHLDGLEWEKARAKCVEEGGHLAVINTEAESTVLQLLMAQHPELSDYFLIGFHDRYTEGQFLTIFGTPLSSTGFARWFTPSQPDNKGAGPGKPGEDCGSVHRNGGLNDYPCNVKRAFFCEQELWG